MTVLDKLADYARERTEKEKEDLPLLEIRRQAEKLPKKNFEFENALKEGVAEWVMNRGWILLYDGGGYAEMIRVTDAPHSGNFWSDELFAEVQRFISEHI